jgi:hypothetical protein
LTLLGMRQHPLDGVGECFSVGDRNQAPVLTVSYDISAARCVRRDDRAAARRGFLQDLRQSLSIRR